MNHLDKLISQYCPNGVQWKKLGDISVISIGEFVHKDKQNPMGKYPVYNGGVSYTGFYDQFNNTAHKIVISARGSCGFVNRVDVDYWAGNSSYSVDVSLTIANWVFVYYYLKQYQGQLMSERQQGGGVPAISKKQVEDISIPLPPLPVQQEIVRILDSMTALIANLDSEIAPRQQQYAHYRDFWICKQNYKQVPFASLGELVRGKRFVRTDIVNSGIPCIHYGDMYTHYGVIAYDTPTYLHGDIVSKMRYAQKGDVVIVGAGENNEDIGVGVAWMGDKPVAVHDACYILSHKQNATYISYYLRTAMYHNLIKKIVVDGKICSFPLSRLGKITIPLPPISVQQEIVAKLDAFESLLANLRRERTLRQQQYEYYRERLLSFKETK